MLTPKVVGARWTVTWGFLHNTHKEMTRLLKCFSTAGITKDSLSKPTWCGKTIGTNFTRGGCCWEERLRSEAPESGGLRVGLHCRAMSTYCWVMLTKEPLCLGSYCAADFTYMWKPQMHLLIILSWWCGLKGTSAIKMEWNRRATLFVLCLMIVSRHPLRPLW